MQPVSLQPGLAHLQLQPLHCGRQVGVRIEAASLFAGAVKRVAVFSGHQSAGGFLLGQLSKVPERERAESIKPTANVLLQSQSSSHNSKILRL